MPLIHRITEKDELHVEGAIIVTAAAAGYYSITVDNSWIVGAVKKLSVVTSQVTVHTDFAVTRAVLRLAGAFVNFAVGTLADGFNVGIYQMTNVANDVSVWVDVVISR